MPLPFAAAPTPEILFVFVHIFPDWLNELVLCLVFVLPLVVLFFTVFKKVIDVARSGVETGKLWAEARKFIAEAIKFMAEARKFTAEADMYEAQKRKIEVETTLAEREIEKKSNIIHIAGEYRSIDEDEMRIRLGYLESDRDKPRVRQLDVEVEDLILRSEECPADEDPVRFVPEFPGKDEWRTSISRSFENDNNLVLSRESHFVKALWSAAGAKLRILSFFNSKLRFPDWLGAIKSFIDEFVSEALPYYSMISSVSSWRISFVFRNFRMPLISSWQRPSFS